MPNTKEKGKLIEVLSKHIPYGHATLCLIAEELMAEGATFATDNNVGDKWISVKDRLPEADAGKVLCITQAGHYKILQWIETFDCWSDPFGIDFTNFRNGYITHWMPLPQPPKGD